MRHVGLLAVGVLVLSACGTKDSPTSSTTAATTTATTATPPKITEPQGKLSPDEYKAIHAAYVRLAKLKGVDSMKQAVRITDSGCRPLTVPTGLVSRLRGACVQARRTFSAIHGLEVHKRECTQALNAGDVSCYSNLFRTIGRAARVATVREHAVNTEIRRRGLKGACADTLSTSRKELAADAAITHDAISAANAAERRDGAAFLRATSRLEADFKSDTGNETVRESMRKLKTCV